MGVASITEAVRALSATEEDLRRRISGMSAEELGWTPGPDYWSPREIIGHLADAELVNGFRLRKVYAEENPSYPAFDEESWTLRGKHAAMDVGTLFAAWQAIRRWNLALISEFSDQDLSRPGRHEQAGDQTLAEVVRHLSEHDTYHLRRLDELSQLYRARSAA